MQTATIDFTEDNARGVAECRKENRFSEEYAAFDRCEPVVIVRFYQTDTRAYCCVWVHGWSNSGGAYAGGYGYCKRSAAFEAACNRAGIEFANPVAGVGMNAVEEAIRAIARAVGHDEVFIHHAHA